MNCRDVTLKDIARRCGTSVPTVSYVLSGSGKRYVNQALRQEIAACAQRLGYVPRARRLKGGDLRPLAVVLPQTENVFFSRMVRGLESVAYARGYFPGVFHTDDIADREIDLVRHLATRRFQGLLLVPSERSQLTTEMLRRLDMPYVIAERPLPCEGEFDFFSMDNYHAGYEATQALIRAGHRHIGLITWNNGALTLLDRHVGYARALEEADIQYRPEYVQTGRFSEEDGYRMTGELLARQPELTAILYAYHVPAQGGVKCLRDKGMGIPRDISVVVVGDPVWVEMSSPPMTYMTLPSYSVGERAITALIDRIEGRSGASPQRMAIKGALVEGGSVLARQHGSPASGVEA